MIGKEQETVARKGRVVRTDKVHIQAGTPLAIATTVPTEAPKQ